MPIAEKDPVKAAAGRAGAAAKWAMPEHRRIVRLDALSLQERALVLALIEAKTAASRTDDPQPSTGMDGES